MKALISYITLLSFIVYTTAIPTLAYADTPTAGQVTTLSKGDTAPFDGTLFDVPAAAKLLADLKFTQEQCKIETDRQVGILQADLQLKIDLTQASLDACKLRHTELLQIKDSQIDFLQDQLKPPSWYEHPAFLITVGLIVGAGATIGITYAVNTP